MASALVVLRVALLLALANEVIRTLPSPAPSRAQAQELLQPRWRGAGGLAAADGGDSASAIDAAAAAAQQPRPTYASSLLLRRVQASMAYNRSSGAFETGPLLLWRSTEGLLASDPVAGWGALQELLLRARYPWASYWAARVAPDSWRLMAPALREGLALFAAGVPVLAPPPPEDAPPPAMLPRWLARCSSAVDAESLLPAPLAACEVVARADPSQRGGAFDVVAGPAPSLPRRLVGRGPVARAAARLAAACGGRSRPAALALAALRGAWAVVPTGSLDAPLWPVQGSLAALAPEWPAKVAAMHAVALLALLRNWTYFAIVAYKVSWRLRMLAPHDGSSRLIGGALTLVGVLVGLWQTLAYAALDVAVDAATAHAAMAAARLPGGGRPLALAARWAFHVSFALGAFEARVALKWWRLAKVWCAEAKALALDPSALLAGNANAALVKPPRRELPSLGGWPAPLVIPPEVDDLPVAEVPRGFVCAITQSIMRCPAMLLHDATVAPATYEKEAIEEWLQEHSTDPKNPGRKLRMRSVRLVHNGELARAIEDWSHARLAAMQHRIGGGGGGGGGGGSSGAVGAAAAAAATPGAGGGSGGGLGGVGGSGGSGGGHQPLAAIEARLAAMLATLGGAGAPEAVAAAAAAAAGGSGPPPPPPPATLPSPLALAGLAAGASRRRRVAMRTRVPRDAASPHQQQQQPAHGEAGELQPRQTRSRGRRGRSRSRSGLTTTDDGGGSSGLDSGDSSSSDDDGGDGRGQGRGAGRPAAQRMRQRIGGASAAAAAAADGAGSSAMATRRSTRLAQQQQQQ